MKYVGSIFNFSDQALKISTSQKTKTGTHDVVVVKHDPKAKKSKVVTLTSLVRFNLKGNPYINPSDIFRMANGVIIPVPNSVVGDKHLSGFFKGNPIVVSDNDLMTKKICSKSDLDWRYLNLLK